MHHGAAAHAHLSRVFLLHLEIVVGVVDPSTVIGALDGERAGGDGVVGGVGDGAVDVRGGLDGGSAGRIGVGRGVAVVAAAMGSRVDGVRGGARAGGVQVAHERGARVCRGGGAGARGRNLGAVGAAGGRTPRFARAVGADEAGEVAYVGEGASRVAALLRVKLVEGENVRGMAILVARRRVEGGAVGLDAGRGAVRVRVHVRKASEGRYQGYRAVALDAMAARPRDATN